MPNTRKKLIELLKTVQHSGVVYQQSQMDDRKYNAKQIHNIDVAEHLIANGVTVNEWISVKDRLPEKTGLVLGYDIVFGVLLLYYEVGAVRSGWQSVTHWMPLPEAPKGE